MIESGHLNDFLQETDEMDYSHPMVRAKIGQLLDKSISETALIRTAYEFVRDEIAHSWDIQSTRVTRKASEVLNFGEGICYAKANLLAAMLRGMGIPTGFCYQRLTLGDTPETGYGVHALNAVYMSSRHKWIRLDARGNKDGVDAQFSIMEEKLAFPVRAHFGEVDYPGIYPLPHVKTIEVLKAHTDCLDMYLYHLPAEID
ncbi:transglutaminase-like domain-containing protein [Paenibacillus piri]|uniref:Transglutaminase family protein n=1 Tax=Paenibacillus piri TaxID=2547395 RepID=A0A4R5KWK0_9BACL|nr:transglutaminase family protein [Paenibacillus piri]TDG00177.1 transglutaminase family protein [Paenibacillus piri]